MNELKRIVEDMQSVFAESSYPRDFLEAYDQMECLANHAGRETFLVRRKDDGRMAVAKCYDLSAFALKPDPDLLRDVEHPGLPRFLEQFRNDRILCVVREYVEGEPLSEYVQETRLTAQGIAALGAQLCDILAVLHGHAPPIIHRDIKPENIIVRPDGTLVLIDFDISRVYKERAAGDTVFLGTKGYAPPEQYGFGQTDHRSDLYALGVLLRWMVTGSVKENPNVTIDPRLKRVIDRCTAFSPEARYADVSQVRRDLERVRRGGRPIDALRLLVGAILLLAALCAGFAAGRYTDWLRPTPGIAFSEPLIERAVRLQLDGEGGALTREALEQVHKLYIYGSDVFADQEQFGQQRVDDHAEGPLRTLDDLKLLPNLEEVHIARQGYLDVSGLADLPRIYTVEIKHARISGVQPIAHISRLKHAMLFDCSLADVSALENCPWLETLDVGLNDLTSLREVGSYPEVRSLGFMWLSMDNVDDIGERFPKVQALMLQHGDIRDLSGLGAMRDLKVVYVLQEQYDAVAQSLAGTDVEIRVTEN